jgi:hypothetical protein
MKRILFTLLFVLCLLTSQAIAGKYTSLIATQAALISIEKDNAPEPAPDTGASISTGKVIYNQQQLPQPVVTPQKKPAYNRQPSLFQRRR